MGSKSGATGLGVAEVLAEERNCDSELWMYCVFANAEIFVCSNDACVSFAVTASIWILKRSRGRKGFVCSFYCMISFCFSQHLKVSRIECMFMLVYVLEDSHT